MRGHPAHGGAFKSAPFASNTRAGALVRWRRLSVCSSLIVRADLFSPQWFPFSWLDLHSYSRGQLFSFGGGGRELWCPPFQIQIWAKMAFFGSVWICILNPQWIRQYQTPNCCFGSSHCHALRTRTGFLSVKWGPNLVDFFGRRLANTWYHFIYPCPSQVLKAQEQRGHRGSPRGRQDCLWRGEMMPHIGASPMTLPVPWPSWPHIPLPTAAGPHWPPLDCGGGMNGEHWMGEERRKVNLWSEGFYWDWEAEGEGERMC